MSLHFLHHSVVSLITERATPQQLEKIHGNTCQNFLITLFKLCHKPLLGVLTPLPPTLVCIISTSFPRVSALGLYNANFLRVFIENTSQEGSSPSLGTITLQNYVYTTINSRWQCSDVKSWVFVKRDFLLIMLLHIESKLFFRNCINGNTRAFLSLVIMTCSYTFFIRFSIVKSISGRYWEPTRPITHSKIKYQFPNAILRNRQQQNKLLRDVKLNCSSQQHTGM